MLRILYNEEQEIFLTRIAVLKEAVELGFRRKCISGEIFFCGNKLKELIIFETLLFDAENFGLIVISDEKIIRADTHVPERVVLEDVLDFDAGDMMFLDLHDVKPPWVVLFFVKLEKKVLIEDIPTHHIIY